MLYGAARFIRAGRLLLYYYCCSDLEQIRDGTGGYSTVRSENVSGETTLYPVLEPYAVTGTERTPNSKGGGYWNSVLPRPVRSRPQSRANFRPAYIYIFIF